MVFLSFLSFSIFSYTLTIGPLDPRWASWNMCVLVYFFFLTLHICTSGVFLCIRCSGIHRGMGTHISKVKSIDLDAWTPEQMDVCRFSSSHTVQSHEHARQNIQKWGNRLANLYWEAHLKPGHVPPDQ